MMKKVWKVCVTLILVCTLLPANVYAESAQAEDICNTQEAAVPYLNAAVSERADSDGDADLPAFLQEGESACGSVSADQILSPSTATVSDVVSIIQPIIYTNEVGTSWNTKYGSVTPNDNGYGISAGILQWNASNALYLLRAIIAAPDAEAQQILNDTFSKDEVKSQLWQYQSQYYRDNGTYPTSRQLYLDFVNKQTSKLSDRERMIK